MYWETALWTAPTPHAPPRNTLAGDSREQRCTSKALCSHQRSSAMYVQINRLLIVSRSSRSTCMQSKELLWSWWMASGKWNVERQKKERMILSAKPAAAVANLIDTVLIVLKVEELLVLLPAGLLG
ncbi:hypothetical protein SEMRO_776_G200861.1 [Seminavis robusta]|uniref:Uncharacterized protein n=1 Tax=Seminavis robusta TaxID=568900 RepID=A0A9N8HL22_9STRA|nr:hypothetical protein SEMRO_776_G200861.1 [Seminavis robusta]|eukprot:Sro776_g200861.1  (126) ;mRNA; r:8834-9211